MLVHTFGVPHIMGGTQIFGTTVSSRRSSTQSSTHWRPPSSTTRTLRATNRYRAIASFYPLIALLIHFSVVPPIGNLQARARRVHLARGRRRARAHVQRAGLRVQQRRPRAPRRAQPRRREDVALVFDTLLGRAGEARGEVLGVDILVSGDWPPRSRRETQKMDVRV